MTVLVIEDVRILSEEQGHLWQDGAGKRRPSRQIQFYRGLAELRPEARQLLQRHARYLQENPGFRLGLKGETEERSGNFRNDALRRQRETAVRDTLLAAGLSPRHLEPDQTRHGLSNSDSLPTVPNSVELVYLPETP